MSCTASKASNATRANGLEYCDGSTLVGEQPGFGIEADESMLQ
jgi:hypothetical protein